MVTSNQKPIIDTGTKKSKESKHNTNDCQQIISEKNKIRKEQKRIIRTTRKESMKLQ